MGAQVVRKKKLLDLLFVCIFASLSFVQITHGSSCNPGCPRADGKTVQYQPGFLYEYIFDSILTVSVANNDGKVVNDQSKPLSEVKIGGSVKLVAEGNCGYTLQLGNVKITGVVDTRITQNVQKPIHFTLVDGDLQPNICADANDDEYTLNIKRAIASLFQVNPQGNLETDVFGKCVTHTTTSVVGGATVIHKVRNLNDCSHRERIVNGIFGNGIVDEQSSIKNTPFLSSDYKKDADIENGIVTRVNLVENYKFVGIANKLNSFLSSRIVTNLKLTNPGIAGPVPPITGKETASIYFQPVQTILTKNLPALKTAIQELVKQLESYVHKNAAKDFIELIRLMRSSDSETLLELHEFLNANKGVAHKAYLDALFRVATSESAQVILKLLNKLNEKEKTIALLSLNLVRRVDKATLQQAVQLLNANAPKQVYLAVGHLIAQYCNHHSCATETGVLSPATKKFTENLKHCRAQTRAEEDRIVYALKGIANTGSSNLNSDVLIPTLTECSQVQHSARIRVAALQAYRAAGCDPKLEQNALHLLRDYNEDSELRIEAYLALIACPNDQLAQNIEQIVNRNPVYQVGAFIVSHLHTLRDSTDTTRSELRQILSNIKITKDFPILNRRNSYNQEISYKVPALGVSASLEERLIYSQNGILPRSGRFNLTTELFGQEFNVLELNVRQENLEYLLEYYFGPKGVLNGDKLSQLIQGVGGAAGRNRRSLADETSKVSKKYNTYGKRNFGDINTDISMKLFGSEMLFLSLGDNVPTTLSDIITHFNGFFDNVKHELLNYEKTFNFHVLFLDAKLQYPTGAGAALELQATGFAANQLDVGLNVNIDSIISQDWADSNLRVKIVPSTDIQLYGQLNINAYSVVAGVRLDANAYTATGSDVTLLILPNENALNFDIELPREQLQLLDVELQASSFIAEPNKMEKNVILSHPQEMKSKACFDKLETFGFRACFEPVLLPDHAERISVLRELQRFAVTLESEKKIKIRTSYISEDKTELSLQYSTPGSKVDHTAKLAVSLSTTPGNPNVRLQFANAHHKIALEGGIKNDDAEIVVYGQYENNNNIERNRIGFVKKGNEYQPIVEVHKEDGAVSNELFGHQFSGRIVVTPNGNGKRYQFNNFAVTNRKTNKENKINGEIDLQENGYKAQLHFSGSSYAPFTVNSDFALGNEIHAGFFVHEDRTTQNVWGGSVVAQINDGDYNIDVVGKASSYEFQLGQKLAYTTNENQLQLANSAWTTKIVVKNKQETLGNFKLDGKTVGTTHLELHGELGAGRKIGSVTVLLDQQDNSVVPQYVFNLNAKYNKHFVDAHFRSQPIGNTNHANIDYIVTASNGLAFSVKGELGKRITHHELHIDLNGSAQLNGKDKPTKFILKVKSAGGDKTSTEFKLTRAEVGWIDFTGEFQHNQDKLTAGNGHLRVKDVLVTNGDFKLAKNGKGDFNALIEMPQSTNAKKIAIGCTFHLQGPVYALDTTVTADNKQIIHFKTDTTLDKQKFATKNSLELPGDGGEKNQFQFDATSIVKGEWVWNGELNGEFVLSLPHGHTIDGRLQRRMSTNAKTGISQGNGELHLKERLTTGATRSLALTANLNNFNWAHRQLDETAELTLTSFNGKTLTTNLHLKNVPRNAGQNDKNSPKLLDFGVNVQGDLVDSTPYNLNIHLDGYNSHQVTWRLTGKIADVVDASSNGHWHLATPGQPSTYEIKAQVQAPQSTFKTFDLNVDGKFVRPKKSTDNNNDNSNAAPFMIELNLVERTGGDQHIRFHTLTKGNHKQGTYKFELESTGIAPLKLNGQYERERNDASDGTVTLADCQQSFEFNFGNNQLIKVKSHLSNSNDAIVVEYDMETTINELRNLHIQINGKHIDLNTYTLLANTNYNGQSYNVDAKAYRGQQKRGLDIEVKAPQLSQPLKLVWLYEIFGERSVKLNVDLTNLFDIDFAGNAEANYIDINDFYLLAHWKSVKLNFNDYDLSARGQQKKLTVHLRNSQESIVDGTATYALKQEPGKAVIEGQGQLQYRGKPYNGNFKLMRQNYERDVDQETGYGYTLNGNLGPKNILALLKMTTREANAKLSVCEEHKQCINLQLQSILSADKDKNKESDYTHSSLIIVDLREIGYPYEFEMQSRTVRRSSQPTVTQHHLDANLISTNGRKYQLLSNIEPRGTSQLQLKLPNREVVLEVKNIVPKDGHVMGHYETSLALYWDKQNHPNELSRLLASADLSGVKGINLNAVGNLKFEYPKIRPLTVNGKYEGNPQQGIVNADLIFDVFRSPDQQIVVKSHWQRTHNHGIQLKMVQSVQSTGLGIHNELKLNCGFNTEQLSLDSDGDVTVGQSQRNVGFKLNADRKHIDFHVNGFQKEILALTGDINAPNRSTKWQLKSQLIGPDPISFNAEVQPSHATVTFSHNHVAEFQGIFKLGKQLSAILKDGSGKEVISGHVALDAANFLQTTYKGNKEDIKRLMSESSETIYAKSKTVRANLEKQFEQIEQDLKKQYKTIMNSVPDFSGLQTDSKKIIADILNEIEKDEALHKILEIVTEIVRHWTEVFKNIGDSLKPLWNTLHELGSKLNRELHELFETVVKPALLDFQSTVVEFWNETESSLESIIENLATIIAEKRKEYTEQYKAYIQQVQEIVKPIVDFVQEVGKSIAQFLDELANDLKTWLAQLPTFDELNKEWQTVVGQLHLGEKLLTFLNEILIQLNTLPQTKESLAFLTKSQEYLQRRLHNENIQTDDQLTGELAELLLKALNSIWLELKKRVDSTDAEDLLVTHGGIFSIPDYFVGSFGALEKWSALFSLRFSVLNYLHNESFASLLRHISRNIHVNILEEFDDYDLHGHIIDGHHFITFDGQHFSTQSGNCRFILVQDYVDNNFTLVGQLQNGHLKTLTLIDRDQQMLELNDLTSLKLNGQPIEYPVHAANIHAWRKLYTVTLNSEYGVEIICTNDLRICHIDVNVFYTSKTRGLLGNGNAEPYDDYTKIDGSIATTSAEFLQNYALGKCTVTPAPEISKTNVLPEICEELFGNVVDDNNHNNDGNVIGELSHFWPGDWLVNVEPFRSTCAAIVTEVGNPNDKDKIETAACTVALSYASTMRLQHVNIVPLPDRCLKCPGNVGHDLGSEFTVKIPNSKADVVFVVDVDDSVIVSKLTGPVIKELRKALQTRGFTDVNINVIVHNATQKYPALLTSDNGKLNYNGNLAEVQLNGPADDFYFDDDDLFKINPTFLRSVLTFLPNSEAAAYKLAVRYPFRAGAAKSIISVRKNALNNVAVVDYLRTYLAGSDAAILHAISPVDNLSVEGIPTDKILGFNTRVLATLDGIKDTRKRSKLIYDANLATEYILMNNGWIFATNSIPAMPPADQRKAITQISNIIADSLFKTEIVSDCTCSSAFNGLHANHQCQVKSSNFVASKKVKAA